MSRGSATLPRSVLVTVDLSVIPSEAVLEGVLEDSEGVVLEGGVVLDSVVPVLPDGTEASEALSPATSKVALS